MTSWVAEFRAPPGSAKSRREHGCNCHLENESYLDQETADPAR